MERINKSLLKSRPAAGGNRSDKRPCNRTIPPIFLHLLVFHPTCFPKLHRDELSQPPQFMGFRARIYLKEKPNHFKHSGLSTLDLATSSLA